jgi:hypothetical protein
MPPMAMQTRRQFGQSPTPALYFVEADFGRHGRAFVETDRDKNSRRQVIEDIAQGQLENVIQVLEIFEDEGSCRDVTEDIACDVRDFLSSQSNGVRGALRDWIDQWCGPATADQLNAAAGFRDEVYQPERDRA